MLSNSSSLITSQILHRSINLLIISVALLISSRCQSQVIPTGLLEETPPRSANTSSGTGPLSPSDLVAGPFSLSGSSAYGICYMPGNNPWGLPILVVAELFSAESWVYNALDLTPLSSIPNPPSGISVTGVTTDGTYLYWGVINPPGPNELWRSNPDGSSAFLLGEADIQGGGFIGGLCWDGNQGIWANDITADQYDLLSISDGTYLGVSVDHPDGGGMGNGLAFRADCQRLAIPHGHDFSGRVTTISSTSTQSSIPLGPVDISENGFFINGIESSRPAVDPMADPFGIFTYWVVDNSSNTISVVEGHDGCPTLIDPIQEFECSADSDGVIQVTWNRSSQIENMEIRLDGILMATVPASQGNWTGVSPTLPDVLRIQIQGFNGNNWTPPTHCDLVLPGCNPSVMDVAHVTNTEELALGTPFCGDLNGHLEQSYWRSFSPCLSPFSLSDGLILESIRLGIEQSDPAPGMQTQPLVLKIYQDPDGGDVGPISTLVLLHEQVFLAPALSMNHLCVTLDAPLTIPCDLDVVVEIFLPDGSLDGHVFVLGSNSNGESHETWLSAPGCSIDSPTPLSNLGYINRHIVMQFRGSLPDSNFTRGDINSDNSINLVDAVLLLEALFTPGAEPLNCQDAADGNDDEGVNLADAIFILSYLFIPGSPEIPDPTTSCGPDPTSPTLLDCQIHPNCP